MNQPGESAMWITLNHSFISAVQHHDNPDVLHVRARFEGDLERALQVEAGQIETTPEGDYRYRVNVTRAQLAEALVREVEAIDYTNFKASVQDNDRHTVYLRAWEAMRYGRGLVSREMYQGDLFEDGDPDLEEETYYSRDYQPPEPETEEPLDNWADWRLPSGME